MNNSAAGCQRNTTFSGSGQTGLHRGLPANHGPKGRGGKGREGNDDPGTTNLLVLMLDMDEIDDPRYLRSRRALSLHSAARPWKTGSSMKPLQRLEHPQCYLNPP